MNEEKTAWNKCLVTALHSHREQQITERRRQTCDKSVDLVFQSGPLHERLRLETLSLSLSPDGLVDCLGSLQPLAALNRTWRLYDASCQSIQRLPRVRRKLLSGPTHTMIWWRPHPGISGFWRLELWIKFLQVAQVRWLFRRSLIVSNETTLESMTISKANVKVRQMPVLNISVHYTFSVSLKC